MSRFPIQPRRGPTTSLRAACVLLPMAILLGGLFGGAHALTDGARFSPAETASDYPLSSLRILNRVVLLVKEQYVEPDRINPREMLLAALGAVEETVPEVVVNEPDGDRLSVQVGEDKQVPRWRDEAG